ncbi:MAG: YkgJ family cysteine cluster protein [Deltaproteobacteria bacterium]|nr:YkgJ family cysteine cluster protein [Deltaproteobacteria bacterium]MBW2200540.1 YkgJ family cysteine cluster protein [Deltaproteobacteria bacterium]
MDTLEKMAGIDPVRVGLDHTFKFKCHKKVKCFTKCCRGINIILTPYDIIRLKNCLQLTSEEFLALYTEPHILEKTDLPVVTLKVLDDNEKSCLFVREEGCIVYEDRPTTCRYYPLGVASLSHKEDVDGDEFYFFVHEPHCLGFEEEATWTVREWRKNQGVDIHDEINAEWTDLIVRKRSFPPNIKLSEQSKKMFFLASYNIDKFRQFVFESSFLDRYVIDEETIEKIKKDEIDLLKFGLKWLKGIFFKEGPFGMKEGA